MATTLEGIRTAFTNSKNKTDVDSDNADDKTYTLVDDNLKPYELKNPDIRIFLKEHYFDINKKIETDKAVTKEDLNTHKNIVGELDKVVKDLKNKKLDEIYDLKPSLINNNEITQLLEDTEPVILRTNITKKQSDLENILNQLNPNSYEQDEKKRDKIIKKIKECYEYSNQINIDYSKFIKFQKKYSAENKEIIGKYYTNTDTDDDSAAIDGVANRNKIDTYYSRIIEFAPISDVFRLVILILMYIAVFFYIFVLIISLYNVINLIIKIVFDIINYFYNKDAANSNTLIYNVREILNCNKNNYQGDILNVLTEQSMALSVFNITIYIIYILLFYIIIYALFRLYVLMQRKAKFEGNINDIDPKFTILVILGLIFIFSFIHFIYYKLIFKKIAFNSYKTTNGNDKIFEETLNNILITPKISDIDIDTYFNNLTDTSKRQLLNEQIEAEISKLNEINNNDNLLIQYLLVYDIYVYFEENTDMSRKNDIIDYLKYKMKKSYNFDTDNDRDKILFISFLSANERKMIKPYHEQLPFYENIDDTKVKLFTPINEKISENLGKINKYIISYPGFFYGFLFACIYIITIFIYNYICVYVIMKLASNAGESVFPRIILSIINSYLKINDYIIKIFYKNS